MSRIDVREAVGQAHCEEWARVVASLASRFGDLDIAEEAAAEAFATAVERWPADKALDRIRRENKRGDKHEEARLLYGAVTRRSRCRPGWR